MLEEEDILFIERLVFGEKRARKTNKELECYDEKYEVCMPHLVEENKALIAAPDLQETENKEKTT